MEEKVKTFTEMLYDDEVLNEGGEYVIIDMVQALTKKIEKMDKKIDALYRAEGLGDPREA